MSHAPRTPRSDPEDDTQHAHYLPRDIPYHAPFEDSIETALLSPSRDMKKGLKVLSPDSAETSIPDRTIHASDIDISTLPTLSMSDLPLPLSDSRRIFASPLPGINLTHPGGYIEGGPGYSPHDDEFARQFIPEHGIRNSAQLTQVVAGQIAENVALLEDRMRARRKAKEENGRIQREIKALTDQMEMETRVLSKAREKARERRERKARKRVET